MLAQYQASAINAQIGSCAVVMIVIRALRPQRCARLLSTMPSHLHTFMHHDEMRPLDLQHLQQPVHLGLHVQVTCSGLEQLLWARHLTSTSLHRLTNPGLASCSNHGTCPRTTCAPCEACQLLACDRPGRSMLIPDVACRHVSLSEGEYHKAADGTLDHLQEVLEVSLHPLQLLWYMHQAAVPACSLACLAELPYCILSQQ